MTQRRLQEEPVEPVVTPGLIAWTAGVVDACGYLSYRLAPPDDRRLPTLAVTLRHVEHQTNPAVLQLCRLTSVEPILLSKKLNRPDAPVAGEYSRWIVGGIKAMVVLNACLPYLQVQRAEVLKVIRNPTTGKWKALHVRAMANLGWPVDDLLRHEASA